MGGGSKDNRKGDGKVGWRRKKKVVFLPRTRVYAPSEPSLQADYCGNNYGTDSEIGYGYSFNTICVKKTVM